MAEEDFDYPSMITDALRGVARRALTRVAEEGMPGDHHFYLSFRSRGEGVRVPGFLRDQYPEEITVVLQHQFWDLAVDEEAFSVMLAFGGSRQRIYVPFSELTAFVDPTAQLALRFEPSPEEGGEGDDDRDGEGDAGREEDRFGSSGEGAVEGPRDGAPDGSGGATVVSFDRFRQRDGDSESGGRGGEDGGDGDDGPAGDGGPELA